MDYTGATSNVGAFGLPHLLAKTVDVVTSYSPATMFFLSNQKPWTGTQLQKRIRHTANSNGIAFQGLEEFSTEKEDNYAVMKFNPTGREQPVVLSGIEMSVGEAGAQNSDTLLASELEANAHDMAEAIAGKFFTAQTGKEFLSLLDGAGDSTIASSYGGLSRSTYSGLDGNYTNSIGNITLARLRTQLNACTHGGKSPDLMLTGKAIWGYIEALMNATLQTTLLQSNLRGYDQFLSTGAIGAAGAKLVGQAGFNALMFAGVPIVADEKCTSDLLFTLRKETWGFYGVKPSAKLGYTPISFTSGESDGVMVDAPKSLGFGFSGFKMPINQFGEVGHLVLLGNLVCENPRLNGFLDGITG